MKSSRKKPSRSQAPAQTSSRKQVRETTAPRVNVPRQSRRPAERSKQQRSRG